MRSSLVSSLFLLAFLGGCDEGRPPEPVQPVPMESTEARLSITEPAAPPVIPSLPPAEIAEDVDQLRAEFRREVPRHVARTEKSDRLWIERAKSALAESGVRPERPGLIVVVDRNPRIQQLRIIMAAPGDEIPWRVIGGTKVSTGQAGRHDYFLTPTGVFLHSDAILDYRALGTFNENHIRGLGLKGMRIWDFGWQQAQKGWLKSGETGEIRLLMHATDPRYLERKLGRPASEGCVRIPAALNRFLDIHGVLDADYERAAHEDERYEALLRPDRQPTKLAGNLMVIIDSARASGLAAFPARDTAG